MPEPSCPQCHGFAITQRAADDVVQLMRCLFVGPLLVNVVFGNFASLNAWVALVLFELVVSGLIVLVYRWRRAQPGFLMRQALRCPNCRHLWHRDHAPSLPPPQPSGAQPEAQSRRSWFSGWRL